MATMIKGTKTAQRLSFESFKKNHFAMIGDAGHGGQHPDTGEYTTSPAKMAYFETGDWHQSGWFLEGVYNRAQTKVEKEIFESAGYRYFTISHDWKDTPLSERVEKANVIAAQYMNSLLHSNHGNAFSRDDVHGFEYFTSPGDTLSDIAGEFTFKGIRKMFGRELAYRTDTSDGDHDKEARFYMLVKTTMPAILFEHDFFTNPKAAAWMLRYDVQVRFAIAKLQGTYKYVRYLYQRENPGVEIKAYGV